MFILWDLHILTTSHTKSKILKFDCKSAGTGEQQNSPFKPTAHSGYPSLNTSFVVIISYQNSCSQQPPSSQHVWDRHLSYVCYTLPAKGQEYVVNHLHLWVLSLPQIHVRLVFNYVQNSTKKICYLPLPILGQMQVSDSMGNCMRSAPNATHFMPFSNATPKI